MSGFPRTHCVGPIGDAYWIRYLLRVFGVQEGQVALAEVWWLGP